MLGLLYRNQVSLAICDFTLTSVRKEHFDFAKPIVSTRHLLVIREPENHDFYWSNFLAPFSLNLWITLISIFVLGGICVFIINRFKTEIPMNVLEISFVMCEILSQQGLRFFPNKNSLKIVYTCLQYSSLIMTITYAAAIISFLTVIHYNMPFDSFDSFHQNPSYKLAIMQDSSDLDLFTVSFFVFSKIKF